MANSRVALIIAVSGITVLILLVMLSKTGDGPTTVVNKYQIPSWVSVDNSDNDENVLVPITDVIKAKPVYIPQDHPKLVNYIRNSELIRKPSSEPYNLSAPDDDPSMGQSKMILEALKNKRDGFFVECGALDGETRSNTLYMEKSLDWTGLLIEGDPKNYKSVIEKQRRAYTINACLAIYPYPHQVQFKQSFNLGRIQESEDGKKDKDSFVDVQCFPFISLMKAMNVTTIDYFSLDIEGDEMKVLRNLPFDQIFIKTLSVEFIHGEGIDSLEEFMIGKDYKLLGKITRKDGKANDLLFIHNNAEEATSS